MCVLFDPNISLFSKAATSTSFNHPDPKTVYFLKTIEQSFICCYNFFNDCIGFHIPTCRCISLLCRIYEFLVGGLLVLLSRSGSLKLRDELLHFPLMLILCQCMEWVQKFCKEFNDGTIHTILHLYSTAKSTHICKGFRQ